MQETPCYIFFLQNEGEKYGFGTAPLQHGSSWSFLPFVL